MVKTITFKDKTYEIVEESVGRICSGCAFYDGLGSRKCNDEQKKLCSDEQAIFVEVQQLDCTEQKYTIQELIDKLKELGYSVGGLPRLLELEQQAQLKKDPEYEEFTRLKEKFKDVIKQ